MKKELKEIREKQAKLVADARAALEQITADTDETRAAELEAQHDAHMTEYDALEARAARIEKVVSAEDAIEGRNRDVDQRRRPDHGRTETVDSDGDDEEEQREYTAEEAFVLATRFGAANLPTEIRSLLSPAFQLGNSDLPPELRAQGVGTDSAGGFTVPEGFQAEIIKSMAAWGPMLDPGTTRVLTTATGNDLPWPTVDDTSNQGALLAENTQEGEQDVTFGQKSLGAYKYGSDIVRVSIELLQDSAFDMDALLSELFGERLGRIGNAQLTTGTGSGQPNGIMTASTLGVTAAGAAAITMDELIDLQHSVDPAYRASPRVRWMFADSTLQLIRKLKDGDGNYLWQAADARSGEPATLLGNQYVVNQAVAAATTGNRSVAFGDMNKYVVRRVRDFTMFRLSERYADFFQVGFLAFNRIDGELMDTAAVKHLVQA